MKEQFELVFDLALKSAVTVEDFNAITSAQINYGKLLDSALNCKGLFDTPVERRRRHGDGLYAEAMKDLRQPRAAGRNIERTWQSPWRRDRSGAASPFAELVPGMEPTWKRPLPPI